MGSAIPHKLIIRYEKHIVVSIFNVNITILKVVSHLL